MGCTGKMDPIGPRWQHLHTQLHKCSADTHRRTHTRTILPTWSVNSEQNAAVIWWENKQDIVLERKRNEGGGMKEVNGDGERQRERASDGEGAGGLRVSQDSPLRHRPLHLARRSHENLNFALFHLTPSIFPHPSPALLLFFSFLWPLTSLHEPLEENRRVIHFHRGRKTELSWCHDGTGIQGHVSSPSSFILKVPVCCHSCCHSLFLP